MEEQRNTKPAEPIKRGWRIGRQQLIGLWWLMIPLVAILAAILFPVFERRSGSWSDPCLARLKMLAIAMYLYVEDNDGRLPPASSWHEALLHDIEVDGGWDEDAFVCPKTKNPYVFNNALAGQVINQVSKSEEVPLLWDAPTHDGTPPHSGRFSVVFLDGHVQWLDEATFSELMIRGR